jgi:hypothetical protein
MFSTARRSSAASSMPGTWRPSRPRIGSVVANTGLPVALESIKRGEELGRLFIDGCLDRLGPRAPQLVDLGEVGLEVGIRRARRDGLDPLRVLKLGREINLADRAERGGDPCLRANGRAGISAVGA